MKQYPSLPILSAAAMRACDGYAMREDGGVPSQTLMERAAAAVTRQAYAVRADGPVTVLCGGGNNGGDGFAAAAMRGSEHNDPFGIDGMPAKNGSGGVNGGITNGAPIVFRVAFKPTSSISRPQRTLNFESGEMTDLVCKGRHDACFALRTPVIVEAMTAIVLADLTY